MSKIDIGQLLGGVLEGVVKQTLSTEAKKTSNDMKQADVSKIEPKVTAAVKKAAVDELQDVVDNQTNEEPVWKSRILRGAVIGLLGLAATVFKDYNDDGTIPLTDLYGYGTTALGFIYVIYGRLTSAGTPTV